MFINLYYLFFFFKVIEKVLDLMRRLKNVGYASAESLTFLDSPGSARSEIIKLVQQSRILSL